MVVRARRIHVGVHRVRHVHDRRPRVVAHVHHLVGVFQVTRRDVRIEIFHRQRHAVVRRAEAPDAVRREGFEVVELVLDFDRGRFDRRRPVERIEDRVVRRSLGPPLVEVAHVELVREAPPRRFRRRPRHDPEVVGVVRVFAARDVREEIDLLLERRPVSRRARFAVRPRFVHVERENVRVRQVGVFAPVEPVVDDVVDAFDVGIANRFELRRVARVGHLVEVFERAGLDAPVFVRRVDRENAGVGSVVLHRAAFDVRHHRLVPCIPVQARLLPPHQPRRDVLRRRRGIQVAHRDVELHRVHHRRKSRRTVIRLVLVDLDLGRHGGQDDVADIDHVRDGSGCGVDRQGLVADAVTGNVVFRCRIILENQVELLPFGTGGRRGNCHLGKSCPVVSGKTTGSDRDIPLYDQKAIVCI